ncbi:phosphopantetheine-binding protein [Agathobacter rectalis]|uniref:phosphopantetheine-binding protein n=1 Tax=Agathobacter rectalis TaxID=39491 RepID=UPI003B512A1C
MGGDSLLATQLNAEINKKFNINLSLEKIFSNPIFAEQAISIASMLEDLCAGEIL